MQRCEVIAVNSSYDSGNKKFPPIGTKGTVIRGVDEYGDYTILFDNYPCPTLDDPSWETHHTMIVFINDDTYLITKEEELCY